MNPEFLLSLVSGLTVLIAGWAGLYWRIYKAESRIHSRVSSVELQTHKDMSKLKEDLLKGQIEAGNQFMRKDSFTNIMNLLEARLIRIEGKIDSAIHVEKGT